MASRPLLFDDASDDEIFQRARSIAAMMGKMPGDLVRVPLRRRAPIEADPSQMQPIYCAEVVLPHFGDAPVVRRPEKTVLETKP